MSNLSIRSEHLCKSFSIGSKSDGLLRDNLLHIFKSKKTPSIHTALNDLNFELEQGQSLGMIGRNGAGKSTLLKIISKITRPSSGKVEVWGRVASLLEVGTGFHQELTGKENIFLSGAVMGMKYSEIKTKYDEIVDFSGVEKFLDTPVKRYSTGMYVRLAFAVAANLESDLLLVDEVLAVGDAEFQKKCMGKMQDVTSKNGRTVVFVSHNMQVIKQLCTKGMFLKNGSLGYLGDPETAITKYLESGNLTIENKNYLAQVTEEDPDFRFANIEITQNGVAAIHILNSSELEVSISYLVKNKIVGLQICIDILDASNILINRSFFYENTASFQEKAPPMVQPGEYTSTAKIPADVLLAGRYTIAVFAYVFMKRHILPEQGIEIPIEVLETGEYLRSIFMPHQRGMITLPIKWTTKAL